MIIVYEYEIGKNAYKFNNNSLYTHVIMSSEVFLKPLKDVLAAQESENTLVQIGALSSRETLHVM